MDLCLGRKAVSQVNPALGPTLRLLDFLHPDDTLFYHTAVASVERVQGGYKLNTARWAGNDPCFVEWDRAYHSHAMATIISVSPPTNRS
jgi:hypothetical protein